MEQADGGGGGCDLVLRTSACAGLAAYAPGSSRHVRCTQMDGGRTVSEGIIEAVGGEAC
jgi:hypothetical protein